MQYKTVMNENGVLKKIPLDEHLDFQPTESPDLSCLDDMGREELIALVRRCAGAFCGYALLNDEEAIAAIRLKCLSAGLSQKDIWKALPPLKEWMDRTKGKAPQSIAMTVEDRGVSKLTTEKLLQLERELARLTGEDSIIVRPMPEKLED